MIDSSIVHLHSYVPMLLSREFKFDKNSLPSDKEAMREALNQVSDH